MSLFKTPVVPPGKHYVYLTSGVDEHGQSWAYVGQHKAGLMEDWFAYLGSSDKLARVLRSSVRVDKELLVVARSRFEADLLEMREIVQARVNGLRLLNVSSGGARSASFKNVCGALGVASAPQFLHAVSSVDVVLLKTSTDVRVRRVLEQERWEQARGNRC